MTTEKIYAELSAIRAILSDNGFGIALARLDDLTAALYDDIKKAELKKTKGNDFVKRSELIRKLLVKTNPFKTEFQKAWKETINGDIYQIAMMNGYYCFAFKNPLDLPEHTANDKPCNAERFFTRPTELEEIKIDVAEIKTAYKLHKATKTKDRHITKIGQKYFDSEYILNIVSALGENITIYQTTNKLNFDFFENENGTALLMPVRPPKNEN